MLCRSVLEMAALTGSTIDIWELTSGRTSGMITSVGMAAQHGGQVGEIHYGITEPLRTKGMKAQRRMIYILHCMKIVKNLADNTRYRRTTAQLVNVW